ncbi:MAG: DUF4276 family protein [Bacteroides sp.]|nr:DUF4276 family protein [Bacteroides sp.]MCM1085363.1 DUF4276 family protein [Bacteroides sp.]
MEKLVILHVLCEGQTEAEFVKHVLSPYLRQYNIITKNILLNTSQKKKAQGGLISYQQVKRDLRLLMKQESSKTGEIHCFTTMFDFYALPNDFPGYGEASVIHDSYQKVAMLEKSFKEDISHSHFIPYIQLHEFETLLFCGIEQLAQKYHECDREIRKLNNVLAEHKGNPELVNDGTDTAPSKRIINAINDTYHYDKPRTGREITEQIGINTLKEKCRHFSEWIEKLEQVIS